MVHGTGWTDGGGGGGGMYVSMGGWERRTLQESLLPGLELFVILETMVALKLAAEFLSCQFLISVHALAGRREVKPGISPFHRSTTQTHS